MKSQIANGVVLSCSAVLFDRWRRAAVSAILSLFLGSSAAVAQTATVTRNVNLRPEPSTEETALRLLTPPTPLRLLDAAPEDGFYHVRTIEGQQGWVWAKNVKVDAAAFSPMAAAVAGVISPTWDKPTPNKSSFTGVSGKCGWGGVGAESASNHRKNRTDLPTSYHDVDIDAILDLPQFDGYPKSRSKWSAEQLAELAEFEGVAVRVKGFLVAVRASGSKEGTNCKFTKAAETDRHMALAENQGDGEKEAIAIETTPRIRRHHPNWTKGKLAPWTNEPHPVRISGWLFFDTEHGHDIGHLRATSWEIHPITKIEVFKGGKWVNLDDIQ